MNTLAIRSHGTAATFSVGSSVPNTSIPSWAGRLTSWIGCFHVTLRQPLPYEKGDQMETKICHTLESLEQEQLIMSHETLPKLVCPLVKKHSVGCQFLVCRASTKPSNEWSQRPSLRMSSCKKSVLNLYNALIRFCPSAVPQLKDIFTLPPHVTYRCLTCHISCADGCGRCHLLRNGEFLCSFGHPQAQASNHRISWPFGHFFP